MVSVVEMALPLSVVSAKRKLDVLFARVADIDDLELQAHWARYLCVLASGYVEGSVRAILTDYSRDKAAPPVRNYVESRLARFQNAKMQRIVEEVARFSPEWARQLEEGCRGQRKDAVDSLVSNRHQIAHGADVGITFIRVSDYFARAHEVVVLLHEVTTS
jgi:hypothetical protein